MKSKGRKRMISCLISMLMVFSAFPAGTAFAEGGGEPISDGEYTINVLGWHDYQDQASMMASVLSPVAGLSVRDGAITATLTFVPASIFGLTVDGETVIEVWPEPDGTPEPGTGNAGTVTTDDAGAVKTVSIPISTLDRPRLAINVGEPMNSIQYIRLKFDPDTLEPVNDPGPGSLTLTGKARVEQFGGYDVDVSVTVTDGKISGLDIQGSNYDGTYADNNAAILQQAATAITPRFIGLPMDGAEAINGVDAVSGATYSGKAIIQAVLDALDLELEPEILPVPDAFPQAGVYAVDIAYYTDVVRHNLLKDEKGSAVLRVDSAGDAVLTVTLTSGTVTEPLYLLAFNGYYDEAGVLSETGFSTETATVDEFTVCTQVSFPLTELSAVYRTNTYLYVPAMQNLNGEIQGILFDNGKFNVDSFVEIHWDTLEPVADPEPEGIADGNYTINVAGWHETNESASMMASLLAPTAKLAVQDGQITATVTFIDGSIMNTPVPASSISEVWPEYETKPTLADAGTGVLGVAGEGTNAFTFPLSSLEKPKLAINVSMMGSVMFIRLNFDEDTLELATEPDPEPEGYIPGIYSGVGQGYEGNAGGPDIRVFVQTTDTEIVNIFAGAHDQTAMFFNMAFNGAYGATGIPAAVIEKQSLEGVDVVSGATLSSNGIKQAIAEALQNAAAGNAATPDETQTVPAVIWNANADQPSMMNGMLVPEAEVRKYGSLYTAVIQIGPTTIYGLSVNGADAQNIRTVNAAGEFVTAPITESYDEAALTKTVEVWLPVNTTALPMNYKAPLPMKIFVAPMSSDQTVRLKLTFGVEKEKLEAAITAAESKIADEAIYTEASFAPFSAALDAAKIMLGNDEAIQEQVDAAVKALTDADKALVLKPRDRTANTLEELVDYVNNAVNGDIVRLGADISADADAPQADSKRLLETKVNLTVEGNGYSLDGGHKFGFFYVRSGNLTINNIVIKNAEVNPSGTNPQAGPSVYLPSSTGNTGNLKLTNSIITGSLALNGGVYIAARNFEMENCILIGGSARTGANLYIDKDATGLLKNNIIIGAVPVLDTTNSDVNFGASGGGFTVGENNLIGLIYSGFLPASVDPSTVILGNYDEEEYTPESWAAFQSAWDLASVISQDRAAINETVAALRTAIIALVPADDAPDSKNLTVDLSGPSGARVGENVVYTLSVSGADRLNLFEFTLDYTGLTLDTVEALNGLSILPDTDDPDTVCLSYLDQGGLTSDGTIPVAKLTFKAESTGSATVLIRAFDAWGYTSNEPGGDSAAFAVLPAQLSASAEITEASPYGEFDINEDGLVNLGDLSTAIWYYQLTDESPLWDDRAAKADQNGDGLIDLGDLIDIYIAIKAAS
jgi:uncharacterized protein with FMN-binding domain